MFLSRYRNTSESLGEREMLWEHEPQEQLQFYIFAEIASVWG